MKFIPILFSTSMVQAILDDRKKQTRRICKIPYINQSTSIWRTRNEDEHFAGMDGNVQMTPWSKCPYGQVGDILWVRESCFWDGDTNFTDISPIGSWHYKADESGFSPKWKPSIHMPKEACRLFLKITNVRVERLQDISEADAEREGINIVDYNCYENYMVEKDWNYEEMNQKGFHMIENPIGSFASLWAKINGEQSWNDNPWVWVIEFERIEKPENFI